MEYPKPGEKFRVLCNKRTNDDDNANKTWISADNGDIIICLTADEEEQNCIFLCLGALRASVCAQSLSNPKNQDLQLKKVRKNAKTTAERLGVRE